MTLETQTESTPEWVRKLEAQIRSDLRRMERDPNAISRLIGIKRQISSLKEPSPILERSAEMVKDIPLGFDCECCGFKNLKNVRRKDGHVVGVECVNHPLGACKR